MFIFKSEARLIFLAFFLFQSSLSFSQSTFKIDEVGCLEYESVRIIPYKNKYYPGRRSGIEIVQNGSRIVTSIDLRDKPVPIPDGIDTYMPVLKESSYDEENEVYILKLDYPAWNFSYSIEIYPVGEEISIAFVLDSLPEKISNIYAMLEIYPGDYFGKSWIMDEGKPGYFPRQFNGLRDKSYEGTISALPMAEGKELILSPEDKRTYFSIQSLTGNLELFDGRASTNHKWFTLTEKLPEGKTGLVVEWKLKPSVIKGWEPEPVIGISRNGYHPAGPKYAIIEDSKYRKEKGDYVIHRFTENGGKQKVKSGMTSEPEYFMQRNYLKVDFTDLRQEGVYEFLFEGKYSVTFRISGETYSEELWRNGLGTFLPVQMCHMEVNDRIRLWHKACHMDDAVRAPDGEKNWLNYYQDSLQDYSAKALEFIEGLNRGGWHDAGDFQLPSAANNTTIYNLCLAYEEFGISTDITSINFEENKVELHTPDGQPDVIQQIRHGLEFLLSSYRKDGYGYLGVIAGDWFQYLELGEADNKTDNVPDHKSGVHKDDRFVFTSRNRSIEFMNAATFAISYRVLKNFYPRLADECLHYAKKAWDNGETFNYNTTGSYIGSNIELHKLYAAVELFLTVKDPEFENEILNILKESDRYGKYGLWSVSRISNSDLLKQNSGVIKELTLEWADHVEKEYDNPYGMSFRPRLFGLGYYNLSLAMQHYYLNKKYPDLFSEDFVFRVINYYSGIHPVDNRSLITGIGEETVTSAFGFNRSDYSYIPGGVIPGPAIMEPDFFEFRKDDPFFWIQTEYTIGSTSAFIFVANAARQLVRDKMIR
jgi:hypothetical protein